jgi:hypothetical protein
MTLRITRLKLVKRQLNKAFSINLAMLEFAFFLTKSAVGERGVLPQNNANL